MEQLETATIVAMWHDEMEFISVQYNPTELTFTKGAQVAEIAIPGLDTPLVQFVRGQAETLSIDLFFDTTEKGMGIGATSVTTLTDQIYQLVKIEPETHAPPVCAFLWNKKFPGGDVSSKVGNQRRTDFQCVVESIKQRFTLFSPEGVPLRAILTLVLREYKTLEEQLKQLNLNSPDKTQSHVVKRGDTLSGIAGRHYQLPAQWRPIAADNGIDDPRRLAAGTFLRVPPIT
jgi:nucleoid-associated protein YgaU